MDATPPPPSGEPWLRVIDTSVELTGLYAHHEVVVARAGRNVTAEALYCGIPTVLLPIDADAHRAAEQSANAAAAREIKHVHPVPDWRQPGSLRRAISAPLAAAARHERRPGRRGNQAATGFLDQIIAAAQQRTIALPIAAPIPKRARAHG